MSKLPIAERDNAPLGDVMTQETLLEEIDKAERLLEEIGITKRNLSAQIDEQETHYLEAKLRSLSLKEELRRLKFRTVNYAPSDRELDIERFRAVLPNLMKKLGNNSES